MDPEDHLLEDLENHHLVPLLMMEMEMRYLHQGHLYQGHLHQNHPYLDHPHHQDHPHQRRNLSRVQMKSHHPSNLKVINRYDSSSVSIKGP